MAKVTTFVWVGRKLAVAITFIMAQIASLDVVSFSGADHAEKLGVGLLTVDSGKPVVAVRDLPGNVFLGPGGPC